MAAGSDTAGAAGSDAGGETLSSDTGEGRLAAGTVSAYLHAVAVKDWAGACATRTRSDRAQLVKLAGSCERGLQQRLAKQSIEGYATATPGAIRQRADTVAVDIVQPGPSTPAETLYLKREDGLWLLVELPAADAF